MKIKFTLIAYLIILCFPVLTFAQVREPLVSVPIYVSENEKTVRIEAGIDTLATDSIDVLLGEEELPPLPPSGIFDVRFVGRNIGINVGNGLLKDFRYGIVGEGMSKVYQINIQKAGNANTVVGWNLPEGISGNLSDFFGGVIVNENLTDSGSCVIVNNNITELRLEINYASISAVQSSSNRLTGYRLFQNYPNPFNPVTNIKFTIPKNEDVKISLFNIKGEKISEVYNRNLLAGEHTIKFYSRSLPSGVYFYKLQAGEFIETMKMVILK